MMRRLALLILAMIPLIALGYSGVRLYQRIEQMKQVRVIVDDLVDTVRTGEPARHAALTDLSPVLFDDLMPHIKSAYTARVDLHPNIWLTPPYTHTITVTAGNRRSVMRVQPLPEAGRFRVVEQEVVRRIEP